MSKNNQKSNEIATCEIDVDVGKTLKRPSQAKLTPAKRKKFLQVFAETFNFTKASQAVGAHRVSVYELIRNDESFAKAFQAVKDAYLDTVEETSISIALRKDARGYNDRRMLLEAHRKEIYGKNPEVQIALQVNNVITSNDLHNLVAKIPDHLEK